MLNVVMLIVARLNVVMLSVVRLNVIILSVVAPFVRQYDRGLNHKTFTALALN